MLIPAMEKQGYTRKFAAAITAASSIIGPIIPPSGIMIIYAYVMGESVAALFLAGIVPGIMIGASLMLMVWFLADRYDLPPSTQRATWGERGNASVKAIWPLMTPVIILGGILGGIFTPTEAAAIAVGYSVLIGFFVMRTLKLSDLPDIMMRAGMTSAVVLLLVGAAMAFKTVASLSHTPELLAEIILGLSDNPLILLFLINVLLFIVGMFLDAGPAIIILGPILGPIFTSLGVDSVHFAIIMALNLTVGLLTPPMGLVLFVTSSVSGLRVETVAKATLPFLAVEVIVIFLITYFPALTLTVPRLFGFVQ
jgi:tripartite ATP-independent transporter DctM subunit